MSDSGRLFQTRIWLLIKVTATLYHISILSQSTSTLYTGYITHNYQQP